MNTQHSDYKWYKENLKDLYEKYGDCYIAIKNKTVIGVYQNFHEGVAEIEKTEPRGTYIMQQCVKNIEETFFDICTPFF